MNNPFEALEKRLSSIETLLIDIKQKPLQKENTDPLLDFLEKEKAMEVLGVSHTTLWRWEKAGKLVSRGIGSKRYYSRSEIMSVLEPNK
ncbi:helix-turn-helix domain-containing protein [Sediminibacter sp. Hel_I_10]|uniref:helix-turn-helix domain-containing protein n=1 Tax=Sediminibacter sp. Hel_I_10 TaxID=1392490 RepID=UPI00068ADB68|nr:helix-turn-helix domain-containing protein [Sediminibacter sp. Hel_I_10]